MAANKIEPVKGVFSPWPRKQSIRDTGQHVNASC